MAKIVITGSRGQLGRALTDIASDNADHEITGSDIENLDICDYTSLEQFIAESGADYLINCAAYTAVDKAEEEPEKAYAVNSFAVKNLAILCNKYGIRLIHISTDYVFDGISAIPYREDNIANPASVYGQSKLEGETAILYNIKRAVIIRTSWLYYHGGKNFVNTMIRLAQEKRHLQVVYDQVGAPTYARDLAAAIISIIESNSFPEQVEIYHYSNSGVASWFDFAKAIIEIMDIPATVAPVDSGTFRQLASRPAYSVLNCSKLTEAYNTDRPYWRDSLKEYLIRNKNYDNK